MSELERIHGHGPCFRVKEVRCLHRLVSVGCSHGGDQAAVLEHTRAHVHVSALARALVIETSLKLLSCFKWLEAQVFLGAGELRLVLNDSVRFVSFVIQGLLVLLEAELLLRRNQPGRLRLLHDPRQELDPLDLPDFAFDGLVDGLGVQALINIPVFGVVCQRSSYAFAGLILFVA